MANTRAGGDVTSLMALPNGKPSDAPAASPDVASASATEAAPVAVEFVSAYKQLVVFYQGRATVQFEAGRYIATDPDVIAHLETIPECGRVDD